MAPIYFFLALFFFGINLAFGTLYFLVGAAGFEGMHTDTHLTHFLDSFFFSVQSFATIGYGRISPISVVANLLVTVEALTGILFAALATGLVFGRFSKPLSKIIFSENAIITTIDGALCLVIRVANERLNQITEAEVQLYVVQNQKTKEGETYRDFTILKLERDRSPLFALSWTIVHYIDETSPFFNATQESLTENNTELFAHLIGVDEVLSQRLFSKISYLPGEIKWGVRFQDVITRNNDGKLEIDLLRFHDTQSL